MITGIKQASNQSIKHDDESHVDISDTDIDTDTDTDTVTIS
jgi:hypothetical protein